MPQGWGDCASARAERAAHWFAPEASPLGTSDDRAGVERISRLGQARAVAADEYGPLEFLGDGRARSDRRFGRSLGLLRSQSARLASGLAGQQRVRSRARLRGGGG